jgi:YesN/AraC family two-component response regulator
MAIISELIEKNLYSKKGILPENNIPFYKVVLISKSSGTFYLNKKQYPLIPPIVFCLNEKDCFEIEKKFTENITILYFHPTLINNKLTFENIKNKKSFDDFTDHLDSDTFIPFYERDNDNSGFLKITESNLIRMENLINNIQNEINEKNKFWPCRSRSYLIELLFLLVNIHSFNKNNSVHKSNVIGFDFIQTNFIGNPDNEIIKKILSYISENYYKKISVSILSKEFGTNRTSLNNLFKKSTGLSVMEYIIRLRIHIAQTLLRETTLPVSEISYRTGYEDLNNFGRIFKKLTGITPSEFRNKK